MDYEKLSLVLKSNLLLRDFLNIDILHGSLLGLLFSLYTFSKISFTSTASIIIYKWMTLKYIFLIQLLFLIFKELIQLSVEHLYLDILQASKFNIFQVELIVYLLLQTCFFFGVSTLVRPHFFPSCSIQKAGHNLYSFYFTLHKQLSTRVVDSISEKCLKPSHFFPLLLLLH